MDKIAEWVTAKGHDLSEARVMSLYVENPVDRGESTTSVDLQVGTEMMPMSDKDWLVNNTKSPVNLGDDLEKALMEVGIKFDVDFENAINEWVPGSHVSYNFNIFKN